jgi:predicted acylesterase/phospholipase RssA
MLPSAKIRARLIVLLLVFLVPAAGRASLVPEANCGDLLPQVLNVGLPQPRDSRTSGFEKLRQTAAGLFSSMYRDQGRCHGGRRLQVNIAIGNDYQILDWLAQGLIDVAVVPDLSVYLLHRDGVELLELNPVERGFENVLTPAFSRRLRSRSFAGAAWTERPHPEEDFESFRWQLWCGLFQGAGGAGPVPAAARQSCGKLAPGSTYRIALASHLDTGGFLWPVSETVRWLGDRLRESKLKADAERRQADAFWAAFFDHARFTLDGTLEDGWEQATGWVEIAAEEAPAGAAPGPTYEDHLVITARAAAPIFEPGELHAPDVVLPKELKAVLERDPAPAPFRPLLTPDPYFGVRTFGFTVDESIGLLRQHQKSSGKAQLALVLPGGGVKAVYQTRLVDALYQGGYLKNALTKMAPRPEAKPVDVDFVIGTSGGALLGYFVARLAERGPWNLSQVLWENRERKLLDSTDIFGWTDLPRYLSVVAILFVFALLLSAVSMAARSPISTDPPPRQGVWRTRLWLSVWPLLLLAPVLVRWVNGKSSQEHVPEIEGFFYFLCASLAIFADQCLVLKPEARPAGRLRGYHSLGPLLLGASLVMLPLLPVWGAEEGGRWIDQRVAWINLSRGSLLVCLGVLCLLVGAILWIYASRRYHLDRVRDFRAGFLLSLLFVLGVFGVLGAVIYLQPDLLSPLELTLGFWAWLLATSVVLGLLILVAGCTWRHGRWSPFRGLTYLCSHHPNSFLVSRRFFRIAGVTLACFVWWNFVLAPGLYGNAHARDFLSTAVQRFQSEYDGESPGGDPHRLTAHLLVPANVLERDGTRYFLVMPGGLERCPPIASKPGSGALWYTYRIRPESESGAATPPLDCPNFSEASADGVEQVIFASGSPFPIFPAHLVELKDRSGKPRREALVDGGYSNNEPVDAALSVAAEQVLIVESTNPLGPSGTADGPSQWPGLTGPLVADLFRLPGFLFERSQQVDRLSRRGLFVVSLSPWRDEADWPPLFDFRRRVVERLQAVADRDLSRRIGLVESWGPPRFQLSVQVGSSAG